MRFLALVVLVVLCACRHGAGVGRRFFWDGKTLEDVFSHYGPPDSTYRHGDKTYYVWFAPSAFGGSSSAFMVGGALVGVSSPENPICRRWVLVDDNDVIVGDGQTDECR
jgi:hypothetical protein